MSRRLDDTLTAHAARRGTVTATYTPTGATGIARLIAWRPTRRGHRTNTFRVLFTGQRESITLPVHSHQVHPL